MSDSFYVTTPIYYVNDKPHIGHAYTTILGDVLARYHRLCRTRTWFLTGTDEHGQKVQKAAEKNKMTPIEQCDSTVIRFQELWKKLQITNDDFIRTTEPRHTAIVQQVLQDLYDKGEIYRAEYEGHYCVPCERFYTAKDLLEGNLCPDCKRSTDPIMESNYFFKMSQYQQWLIDYIQTHPEFIQPAFRANETLGFLKQPLGDLCISRPKSRLSWGIELPFDPGYVCYVWFDALINYISAVGYGSDPERFHRWWPCSVHLIGKDILTTHTVYWPTMLKAMGVALPKSVFAHGWWLVGQDKMSKSVGNVVNPMDMCREYGVDAFRYFVMSEMNMGQDASFTEDTFITRYNSDLANDLGNLLSRVVKMILRQCEGRIPECGTLEAIDAAFRDEVLAAVPVLTESVEQMRLDRGIDRIMTAVRAGNRYLEQTAPWTLAKIGNTARLETVLYTAAEALRVIGGALSPLMPSKMMELRSALGVNPETPVTLESLTLWGELLPGSTVLDTGSLFQRIEVEPKVAESPAIKKMNPPISVPSSIPLAEGVISFEDFSRVQLKVARVVSAERVEGADKLLRLRVKVGEEIRQIVAGVAQFYSPEAMIGKQIVTVVNLKPAKIRGIDSCGMLLAAKAEGRLVLLTVDGEIEDGASVG